MSVFGEIKPFGALNRCLTSARFLWCGERLRELGERRGKGGDWCIMRGEIYSLKSKYTFKYTFSKVFIHTKMSTKSGFIHSKEYT